jgi:hypothetical protein
MPAFPSGFPLWWIALTALVAAGVSLLLLLLLRRRLPVGSAGEAVALALVVGLSVFGWRLSGNVPELNDDPIPPLSPNDWLCPVITYVCLGLYAAARPPADAVGWARVRALLTVVSFVVNVVVI